VIVHPTAKRINIKLTFIIAPEMPSFCHFQQKMRRIKIKCAKNINAEIILN